MKNSSLTLIGMSGAGKSTLGKILAARLGLEFVDGDVVLSKFFDAPIQDILDAIGTEEYLFQEGLVNMNYVANKDRVLHAPGGSIVYNDVWMEYLKANSTVIYLKAPFELIESRNRNAPPHAIVGLGKKTLRQLYDERHPKYLAAADHVVEVGTHRSDEEVMAEIGKYLRGQNWISIFPRSEWRTSPQS